MRYAVAGRRGRALRVVAFPAVAALIAGAFGFVGPAQAATPSTRSLPGTHPAWATAAAQRGVTPSDATISAQVYLAGRNAAGLAAYAREVSTPGSAQYGHYLTAAQQDAAFGPARAQVQKVKSWLTGAGLKITATAEQYVSVTGTPTAAGRAFGTRLRDYALSGHVYYAPSTNATIPAALASAVLGVSGLDDAPMVARPAAVPTPASVRHVTRAKGAPPYIGLSPCSAYWGQKTPAGLPAAYGHANPLPVCGYTPNQLRDAYGVAKTGLTGKGTTVAVVDAYGSPTIASDVNTFARYNHFPGFAPGQFRQIVTPAQWNSQAACGGPAGWKPEESLDVEAVHTMAPAARVLYVGANSCQDSDFLSAFAAIIDHRLATIVTNSWGEDLFDYNGNEPASTIRAYTQALEQAATEGIGFYFSSGDCATNDPGIVGSGLSCDPNSAEPQVTFPASDPWATGVGATAIGIGAHQNYLFETGMGDSEATLQDGASWSSLPGTFLFGAGGGTSNYFTQPSYQRDVVPASLAHMLLTGTYSATPMRVVPDVAMEGDLFAATMAGFTQPLPGGSTGWAEAGYGGTSVASPLFAGVQADAQQAARFPIGFANPEIYQRDQRRGLGAFRDITDHPGGATFATAIAAGLSQGARQGALFTLGSDFTLHAAPGFDDVTGVGSPTPAYLRSFGR
ncbi:MAG TPA: S53 family peptidase [Streptosporangiaceae bacterium]|nr:S53 family peptidase [Streptosporangiaceae bacterium]